MFICIQNMGPGAGGEGRGGGDQDGSEDLKNLKTYTVVGDYCNIPSRICRQPATKRRFRVLQVDFNHPKYTYPKSAYFTNLWSRSFG